MQGDGFRFLWLVELEPKGEPPLKADIYLNGIPNDIYPSDNLHLYVMI